MVKNWFTYLPSAQFYNTGVRWGGLKCAHLKRGREINLKKQLQFKTFKWGENVFFFSWYESLKRRKKHLTHPCFRMVFSSSSWSSVMGLVPDSCYFCSRFPLAHCELAVRRLMLSKHSTMPTLYSEFRWREIVLHEQNYFSFTLYKGVWLTKHVLLSFQWRSSPEPWLWLYTCSRRVCTRPAYSWGLFTCAGRLCCSSTTKRTISLRTTSDECLWTSSTAHGISICPDSRFGNCVAMTGRVCLVLVVKKSQWYGQGWLSPSRILVLAKICHMLLIITCVPLLLQLDVRLKCGL